MKKQKKKRKGFQASSMRCPYCGSPTIYRSAERMGFIMITVRRQCSMYAAVIRNVTLMYESTLELISQWGAWPIMNFAPLGGPHITILTSCTSLG